MPFPRLPGHSVFNSRPNRDYVISGIPKEEVPIFLKTAQLVMSRAVFYKRLKLLLWLQVGILMDNVLDAGAGFLGIQVVVPQDQGAGVALMELFK